MPDRALGPAPAAVLFDIDGTLAVRSSAHLEVLTETARERFHTSATLRMDGERPIIGGVDVSGWIDAQVVRLLIEQAGDCSSDPGVLSAFMDDYGRRFRAALATGAATPGVAVPGVAHAVARMAAAGAPLGLVTGNASVVAQAKLEALRLATYFQFDRDAGFGDWRACRADLAPAALTALGLAANRAVRLVGDTAADMRGARASGLRAVGVLTGAHSAQALRAAGADDVLASAAEVDVP